MLKIEKEKEKLILVMTQDEKDSNFANALKKFGKHKDLLNTLKDLKVKVNANDNISEFSTEIESGEDLQKAVQKLDNAKVAIYHVLHRLEAEENPGEMDNLIGKLIDRMVVFAIMKGIFEDGEEPGTQCPTEEE